MNEGSTGASSEEGCDRSHGAGSEDSGNHLGSLSPDFGATPDPENSAFIGLDPSAILDLFCETRWGFVGSYECLSFG